MAATFDDLEIRVLTSNTSVVKVSVLLDKDTIRPRRLTMEANVVEGTTNIPPLNGIHNGDDLEKVNLAVETVRGFASGDLQLPEFPKI